MYKHFHHLANSTTSLVGYIGLLIIAGSYLGGTMGIQAQSLKGSLSEYGVRKTNDTVNGRFVTVRIDGREYRAELREEAEAMENVLY
ncbi:MAG: hypothetical protein ACD_78C00454G0001 [uncultured bacterium (gcode 4)]|uniref:Uncharacterized protein n=1 Tax=uncultured bacterium (gcode 4) TaxID=1234023 RepID=K1XVM9_9BACT|nr:MAG: hypothetical protein ACD_78C00454G0001 [uncultured bacterium (gcode 4)]